VVGDVVGGGTRLKQYCKCGGLGSAFSNVVVSSSHENKKAIFVVVLSENTAASCQYG